MKKEHLISNLQRISKAMDLINPGDAIDNCSIIDARIEELKSLEVDFDIILEEEIAQLMLKYLNK